MWKGRVVLDHDGHKHELKLTGTEHMVIIVSCGDGSTWLIDVGFGGQVACHPLRIDHIDLDPPQDSRTYGISLCFVFLIWVFPSSSNKALDFV